MIVQSVESRPQQGGRLRNVRRLWQCRALPAALVLATVLVFTCCPGLVSAGETNSFPAPQAATSFAPSLTVSPALPTATYGFNEGNGNTTADASGNGNMGTLSGPSWTTAGHYGYALSFSGTNAYVEAANSNSLNPGTAATFSAWVNVLAANAHICSVINKRRQTLYDHYLFGTASRLLNGIIDEVRMYNQALTPAQIQGDMNAPIGKTALPTATYGFNEGSGNTTADASGNANLGTLSGPSWTTAGHYGYALSFNGTNAYVEAANSNSLNPGTAATFSAWVNVLAANANISSVINKWSQTIDDDYLFGLDSSNRLTFAWQTTGGNVWGRPSYNIVSGNAQIPLGTWTYITVVRNGPGISFYG